MYTGASHSFDSIIDLVFHLVLSTQTVTLHVHLALGEMQSVFPCESLAHFYITHIIIAVADGVPCRYGGTRCIGCSLCPCAAYTHGRLRPSAHSSAWVCPRGRSPARYDTQDFSACVPACLIICNQRTKAETSTFTAEVVCLLYILLHEVYLPLCKCPIDIH